MIAINYASDFGRISLWLASHTLQHRSDVYYEITWEVTILLVFVALESTQTHLRISLNPTESSIPEVSTKTVGLVVAPCRLHPRALPRETFSG